MAPDILRTFAIVLDSPAGSYFPGNVVSGRVILEPTVPQKAMGFELNISGREYAIWKHWPSESRYEIQYQAGKVIFDMKIFLGPINATTGMPMPYLWLNPGRAEFPFAFTLPLDLNSSFEPDWNDHGYIRYNIQARLNNQEVNCQFTVNAILDLNGFEGAAEPAEFYAEKYIGCCCCKSGPISLTAKLNRTGYVPGEGLEFVVEMSNMSKKPVTAIRTRILRKESYHTTLPIIASLEEDPKVVIEFRGEGVAAGQIGTYQPDPNTVKIPSVAPTDLGGSDIVNIMYILEFELILPFGHSNLKARYPLTIRTIPFRNNFSQLMPPGGVVSKGTAATEQLLIPSYPDLPPVTFETCFFTLKDKIKKGQFVPKYVMYSQGGLPAPNATHLH